MEETTKMIVTSTEIDVIEKTSIIVSEGKAIEMTGMHIKSNSFKSTRHYA